MADVRVLVVDDSAAMRALFCDLLDNAKGVTVCGTARNADDARDQIAEVKPDVLTLDVEMPGMSGMEFLEEIMETKPMPVIMLSSITQEGTGTAARAMELGAVHCFPKPLHSSGEEFNATVAKLGGIVIAAATGELQPGGGGDAGGGAGGGFEPDGSIVVLSASAAGFDSLKGVLAAYPSNCPPTLVVLDGDPAGIKSAMEAMRSSVACKIEDAIDGMALKPGTAYLAYDPARHIVVEAGDEPRIRQVDRDPVGGFRPSADLLLGSLARTGLPAVGGMLVGNGADGAKGMQILAQSSGKVFVQKPADYAPQERYSALKALGVAAEELRGDGIAAWIIEKTAANPMAEAA